MTDTGSRVMDQHEMVEKVARAIYEAEPDVFTAGTQHKPVPWDELAPYFKISSREVARAAIAALQPQDGLAARIEALESRQRVLLEALEPFAIIGQLFHDTAGDTQWREAPLFYCGTKADPQSHTLTGKAFDRARAALAGDA